MKEPERVIRMEQEILEQDRGASRRLLGRVDHLRFPWMAMLQRSHLTREDHAYREGTTPSHTPLQIRFAGLLLHHGQPA